jgi:pimeloyl-ACP methyl ester carboxylesterase
MPEVAMNLFYREAGRGETVVILHGLYGCSDNWVSIARKMADRYRVISVDLRNHGSSPNAPTHTYSDMVTDVAWLFHELSIERAHIIGHSMGGKVAMAFAADYPEMVKSLAVADIAPKNYLLLPPATSQFENHTLILETLSELDLTKFETRKEIEYELREKITDPGVASFILKNLKRGSKGFEWKINVPVLKEYLPRIIGGIDYPYFNERLPITGFPVLFIKGESSTYILDEDLPLIRKVYPEVKFEIIKGATHFLHAEKPDEFLHYYLSFLNEY